MAINLTPEANKLITAYQKRECLPSKASAVNRLILMQLGQPATPSTPPAPPAQLATPPASTIGSKFSFDQQL